jgi:hypothetical protein
MCLRWVTDYYLDIEQCPVDVQAAEQGHQSASFDQKVGEIYEGCNYDWTLVNADTWQRYPDGSTIVFSGDPSEHMRK